MNPCHEALKPDGVSTGDGSLIVEFTASGRRRAADVIRRHRLAERLFTDSLAMDSETEIEQQACKFEHILFPGCDRQDLYFSWASSNLPAWRGHPTRANVAVCRLRRVQFRRQKLTSPAKPSIL